MDGILENLERRKLDKDDPCDSCCGSGLSQNTDDDSPMACGHCLGQGVLLTEDEYQFLIDIALMPDEDRDDSILDAVELH